MHQFTSKYKKIAENERNAQNQGKSGILAHISKIGHKSIYIKHHPCGNKHDTVQNMSHFNIQ